MIGAVVLTIVGILDMLFGLVVFMRERQMWVYRIFMAFVSALAIWTWGIALFIVSEDVAWSQLVVNTYYAAAMMIMSTLVMYVLVMRRDRHALLGCVVVLLPVIGFFGALIANPYLMVRVVDATATSYSQRVVINHGWYLLYAVVIAGLYVCALYLQYRKFRHERTKKARQRERIIIWSLASAGAMGLVFNLILPWLGEYNFIALGPVFAVTFVVGIAYSMFKYSPYDLRQAFARALSYMLALAATAFLYMAGVWMLGGGLLIPLARGNVEGIHLVIALLAALAFSPIKYGFDKLTERLFFLQVYDPKEMLDSYGDLVAGTIDLDAILEGTAEIVTRTLCPSFVAVLLINETETGRYVRRSFAKPHDILPKLRRAEPELYEATALQQSSSVNVDERDQMKVREVGLVARMQGHGSTIGYVILGHKHSGESYSSLDLSVTTTIADELALAVQNTDKYQEIEQFNIRLRSEVSRATRKLRESNSELRAMDQIKDEFVSMASHQLRTPLTSIKGYISMLLDGDAGELSAEQRKFLNEAYVSSERMVRLISDFLNVSRLQTGKFMLDCQQTNLIELVKHCVKQSTQLASGRTMHITYHHAQRVPWLYVDEDKLTQVVANFIDNAVYYTPDGGSIAVTLETRDGEVVLTVKDTGIGVAEHEQRQLFTKFFRAENARIQRPDGTGIGLYLAKKIIDAHGGSVVFESELHHGSSFGFRLPIAALSTPHQRDDLTHD